MPVITSILWRTLYSPGHDACALSETRQGWCVDGAAVFRHDEGPARLDYHAECDREWICRLGRVTGTIGGRVITFTLSDEAEGWYGRTRSRSRFYARDKSVSDPTIDAASWRIE